MKGEPAYKAICHCNDCRRTAGAPMVGWAMVGQGQLKIEGKLKIYHSSPLGRRHFCPECGTGLFYTNAVVFPDMVDVQIATLDNPDEMVPEIQLQVAERLDWMKSLATMPEFDRYVTS
nr:GFA family protein [uncultured Sphingomonas sp.]